MGQGRRKHAVVWLLLASLLVIPACGADTADGAEEAGAEPAEEPGPSLAPDQAAARVDLTGLPGYRGSQSRIERAQAVARRRPPSEWQEEMAIFDDTPLDQAPVARDVALTLLSLPHDGVYTIARASLDDRDAWELSVHLTSRALDFPRIHRDPAFVIPLIERLGRGGDPGAFADHWFEETQLALVAITGDEDAPRYPRARPEDRRRAAQQYWAEWWTANARGFTPASDQTARRVTHRWMNDW